MSVIAGRACRVVVNDAIELRYVSAVDIKAPLDGAVSLTLTVIGDFSYHNGVYRLAGTPLAVPLAPLTVAGGERAIGLGGVPT